MNPRIILIAAAVAGFVTLAIWSVCLGEKAVSKTEYRAPQRVQPPEFVCAYSQIKDENGKCVDLKEGRNEELTSGFVRVINIDQKLIVYETDYGFIKTFEPTCERNVPVWTGMRLYRINFRWVSADADWNNGCFAFDFIGHAEHGDLEMKMVPKQ